MKKITTVKQTIQKITLRIKLPTLPRVKTFFALKKGRNRQAIIHFLTSSGTMLHFFTSCHNHRGTPKNAMKKIIAHLRRKLSS
jgi:Asp-tRNA(Asn)/Glu-tRNA(Gln) amidotransferase B subunit